MNSAPRPRFFSLFSIRFHLSRVESPLHSTIILRIPSYLYVITEWNQQVSSSLLPDSQLLQNTPPISPIIKCLQMTPISYPYCTYLTYVLRKSNLQINELWHRISAHHILEAAFSWDFYSRWFLFTAYPESANSKLSTMKYRQQLSNQMIQIHYGLKDENVQTIRQKSLNAFLAIYFTSMIRNVFFWSIHLQLHFIQHQKSRMVSGLQNILIRRCKI